MTRCFLTRDNNCLLALKCSFPVARGPVEQDLDKQRYHIRLEVRISLSAPTKCDARAL